MTYIFANNAKTNLASPISTVSTTIQVAAGAGSLFPSPTGNQYFTVTLNSINYPNIFEICYCTSRTGDVLTVTRAQEGTAAYSFASGDIVGNFDTAGTMKNLVQVDQLQSGTYSYVDVGGTANALTATIPSNFTTLPDGFGLLLGALTANTGATTLVLTLGTTVLSSYPIIKGNNTALAAGDIPAQGYPIQLNWSPEFSAYVMQNPATGILVSATPVGSLINFPCTTAPTGFLICEGQLVSRSTYGGLWTFAQSSGNLVSDSTWLGGQYGSFSQGDGSTTFRLPQYGGYFLRTLDNGNGIDPSRAIGTVQQNQNQSHNHPTYISDPGHAHTINDPGHYHSFDVFGFNGHPVDAGLELTNNPSYNVNSNNTHYETTHIGINVNTTGISASTGAVGGSESRPVNISVLTCIKY
jgi:microcystin-dependent protein